MPLTGFCWRIVGSVVQLNSFCLTYGFYHQGFLDWRKKKKINKNFTHITYMLLCFIERRTWPFQFKTYLFSYQFFLCIFFIHLLLMVVFSVWFDVSSFGFYINRLLLIRMTIRCSWEKEKKEAEKKRRHWRRAEREESES